MTIIAWRRWIIIASLVAPWTAAPVLTVQKSVVAQRTDRVFDASDRVVSAYRQWSLAGRPWLAHYTGTQWDSVAKKWRLERAALSSDSELAQQVYFAEYALRPALALAESQRDRELIDELSGFYLAFRPRFVTLKHLRSGSANTALLEHQGADSSLVLPWYEHSGTVIRARECQLCAGQFLYPASRLIHVIAEVPPARRTEAMNALTKAYIPLVTKDFILRFAFEATTDRYGFRVRTPGLVAMWDTLAAGAPTGKPTYRGAMLDSDLWLLGTAAEMLTAATIDPAFMSAATRAQLARVVRSGTQFLESKRHVHRVSNAPDSPVSVSYFDGDFCDHPDMAYSGRSDSVVPNRADSARACDASWDISHAYRIPIVLRSVFDARRDARMDYPGEDELRRVTEQYLSRAFYRVGALPFFHAFFDGSDGWYHLYWTSSGAQGYSPPRWCDSRRPDRECLTIGALFGWGLLASHDGRLRNLADEFIDLASSTDPTKIEFRKRYFTFAGQEFTLDMSGAHEHGSLLLFGLLAESLPFSRTRW